MKVLVFIFFLLISIKVYAQEWIWAKQNFGTNINGDDHGCGISTDKNGFSYITGYFQDTISLGNFNLISHSQYEEDIFIVKISPDGEILWAKQMGGKYVDEGLDLAIDANSNIFITGFFQDTAFFENDILFAPYSTNVFLSKLDSFGNHLWSKQAGLFHSGDNYGNGITVDFQGNVYITGSFLDSISFDSYSFTGGGIFTAKFDNSGNCEWAVQEGMNNNSFPYITANKISCDTLGNSYLTGNFSGTLITSQGILYSLGTGDIYLLKYNYIGQLQWAKRMGSPNISWTDEGTDIIAEKNGNFFLTGIFYDNADFDTINLQSHGLSDIFISKWSTNGHIVWAKSAGGFLTDYGFSINLSNNQKLYLSGAFANTAYFGQDSLISNCYTDLFIAEYNTNGNVTNLYQSFGSNPTTDNSWGMSLSSDNNDNVYLTGLFQGQTQIGTTTLISSGFCDILCAKMGPKLVNITNEYINSDFLIYPNPCKDFLIINCPKPLFDHNAINIYDIYGIAKNINVKFQNNTLNIDMSEIHSGIYFLIININSTMLIKKIIKL